MCPKPIKKNTSAGLRVQGALEFGMVQVELDVELVLTLKKAKSRTCRKSLAASSEKIPQQDPPSSHLMLARRLNSTSKDAHEQK